MNAVSRLCLTKEPCLGSYPGFGIGGRGAYPVHPRRTPPGVRRPIATSGDVDPHGCAVCYTAIAFDGLNVVEKVWRSAVFLKSGQSWRLFR